MIDRLKNIGRVIVKEIAPGLGPRARAWRNARTKKKIDAILAVPSAPGTARAEADFEQLQQRFDGIPVGDYYITLNTWKRGVRRALTLVELVPFSDRFAHVLEVGCGDGLTSVALSSFGHDVVISDMEDWRDQRAKSLEFLQGRLEDGLPFPNDAFDFIFTFESFEHFADPAKCFKELTRLCRPGGMMYLNFGPLYASAWGLHAFSSLRMPYAQFLFSESFVDEKVKQLGIWDLGKRMDSLQPLNKWRVRDFLELWNGNDWDTVSLSTQGPWEYLGLAREYPEAFCGRGLSFDDLTTQAITVCLQRRSAPAARALGVATGATGSKHSKLSSELTELAQVYRADGTVAARAFSDLRSISLVNDSVQVVIQTLP